MKPVATCYICKKKIGKTVPMGAIMQGGKRTKYFHIRCYMPTQLKKEVNNEK